MGLDLSALFTFGRIHRMIHEASSTVLVDLASFDEGAYPCGVPDHQGVEIFPASILMTRWLSR
jgi:hypothetical protein